MFSSFYATVSLDCYQWSNLLKRLNFEIVVGHHVRLFLSDQPLCINVTRFSTILLEEEKTPGDIYIVFNKNTAPHRKCI